MLPVACAVSAGRLEMGREARSLTRSAQGNEKKSEGRREEPQHSEQRQVPKGRWDGQEARSDVKAKNRSNAAVLL